MKLGPLEEMVLEDMHSYSSSALEYVMAGGKFLPYSKFAKDRDRFWADRLPPNKYEYGARTNRPSSPRGQTST